MFLEPIFLKTTVKFHSLHSFKVLFFVTFEEWPVSKDFTIACSSRSLFSDQRQIVNDKMFF